MFQYEFEKRPQSSSSCDSRATMTTDWSRAYPTASRGSPNTNRSLPVASRTLTIDSRIANDRARRPLPPRPIVCERISVPNKTTVPLKVWIIASASCFAVCAALVLATVVITKWGTNTGTYTTRELYAEEPEPIYSNQKIFKQKTTEPPTTESDITINDEDFAGDLQYPILEKLSIFKNIVANRDKNKKTEKRLDLTLVSQIHPLHDTSLHHPEKKIEKKDHAKLPEHLDLNDHNYVDENKKNVPDFKPTLPDVFMNNKHMKIKLPHGYIAGLRDEASAYDNYEDYYNDENLYDDYMQSNTMTSYLIEKIQELHEWITSDPDFEMPNNGTKKYRTGNEFGQVLKALNESLVEGNVTIIMNKLKDIYFGDNYTNANHTRKVILSNSTDLLSFGILTLDVMLLHNIQMMAWENQESARNKMLKDPDVFAFNALFLEPSKVEAKQNEIYHHYDTTQYAKRQNYRIESIDDFDIGKNLIENVLEIGMSTARAAIHLGRAYKNTKNVLNQLSNRESLNANIQNQLSRNIDGNSHALNHLQSSFSKNDIDSQNDSSIKAANTTNVVYTELDCIWFLYCKNLAATAKLNAPYGTMARINGMALRMLTGELSAEKALDTMVYEALTGWTELKCNDMFPRCSKVNAATVVMGSILQPGRKSQSANRSV